VRSDPFSAVRQLVPTMVLAPRRPLELVARGIVLRARAPTIFGNRCSAVRQAAARQNTDACFLGYCAHLIKFDALITH